MPGFGRNRGGALGGGQGGGSGGGTQGPQGPQGPAGPVGPQGAQGPAGGSSLGTFATVAALQTAFPAASNASSYAMVNGSGYRSDGTAWLLQFGAESTGKPSASTLASMALGGIPQVDPATSRFTPMARAALIAAGVIINPEVTTGLDGAKFGLVPDTGAILTTQLQTALTAANAVGFPVLMAPGKYLTDNVIDNAGGGLACPAGIAWIDNVDPAYTNVRIRFKKSDGSLLTNVAIANMKFTCSTRPDSGLSNNATEVSGFINIDNARHVRVLNSEFAHNWGGAVLFRSVEDGIINGCYATDLWKDCFHITDASKNCVRSHNVVSGAGDDAFPVVGYLAKGVRPTGIRDIANSVYGVRKARAFAYVGAADCENVGCYVDGRVPDYIPQKTSSSGERYNTACALYIAAESSFGTYGSEGITVTGFEAQYIAPGIDSAGVPTSTLQAIHVTSSNGAGNPVKGIKIQAKLRNIASRGLFVVGNSFASGIEADIVVEDNTDPLGLLSLTNTAGTGNQNAVEVQGARDVKIKVRGNKIGKGLAYIDAACTGTLDVDLSAGAICQTTATQSVIQLAANSQLDSVDFKLNFEVTPPASGPGSINRVIDNPNLGITRSVRVTGVDHGLGAANKVSGGPSRALTLTASPCTVLNCAGRPQLLSTVQGTVTNVSRTSVTGRIAANAVTTGANGTVSVYGDMTDYYTAAKVVTFFNSRGVSLATGTVASAAYTAGTNTTVVTFDATGVVASFAPGMLMAIIGAARTLPGRTSGIFEMPPETAVTLTYSTAPTATALVEPSY
jgi:hypothetical protein